MDLDELLRLLQDLAASGRDEDAKALWIARCATDLELFTAYYFPHYCQYAFNDFHADYFAAVTFMERAIRRVRGAPRGYAKSTLTALVKPLHDVGYGLEQFIVMVSETQDQANQKLRDIRSEVFNNNALIDDFGIRFKTRTPGETQYIIYCGKNSCMFQSYGAGVEVRGIRYGAKRPTKIIVDDGEDSDEVLNESLRAKKENWFFQVISQLGSNDTNIEVIGTVLHPESLLKKLLKNPAYDARLFKAIIEWSPNQKLWDQWTDIYTNLDNPNSKQDSEQFFELNKEAMLERTKVLWPEKEPYLYLMKELVEKGRRAFMKEKQNEPLAGDEILFEQIHFYREVSEGFLIEKSGVIIPWKVLKNDKGEWLNAFAALDPAAGQTKPKPGAKSDFACILTGLTDQKNRLFVHEDWTRRASPTKQISEVFEFHLRYGYQKVGVETNLFRNLLIPNLAAERKRRELETKKEIQISFYDIEQTDKKEKRIYTLEPKVCHSHILFNRALSGEFLGQMMAYPNVDHDDGPDTLEMLWGLVNNRYRPSALNVNAQGGR